MNAEDKQKWCEALRSNTYKQGYMQLRSRDNKFCCLGVALDVLAPSLWNRDTSTEWADANYDEYLLGAVTLDRIGLSAAEQETLASMNDDEGTTFPQIADWIESNVN